MRVTQSLLPLWWDVLTYGRRGISTVTKGRLRQRLRTRGERMVNDPSKLIGSVVTVDGIRMRIDRHFSDKMIRRIVAGLHARPERRLVLSALEPDDIVMELGAGIGMLSIACAQRIGSERVFAYEANPDLQSIFRENCHLNGVAPQLEICLLGRTHGETTFYIASNFSNSSVHRLRVADRAITVPIRPFDDEIARIRPNFLIVDIEGAEDELFAYARLDTVSKMMLEVHPHVYGAAKSNALRSRVRAMGFTEQTHNGRHCLYRRLPGRQAERGDETVSALRRARAGDANTPADHSRPM
jgi:FkbM family methyltransferase